jgi:molecular chaperone HscB
MDYFNLLSLPATFVQDNQQIKARYLALQRNVHPDNFNVASSQEKQIAARFSATVNDAYRTLKEPLKRAIYILKCHGVDTQSETDTQMPLAFLEEQLELREQISAIQQMAEPLKALNEMKQVIEKRLQEFELVLGKLLDSTEKDLVAAKAEIRKMQFYCKLQQEILELEAC